ncbi:hypothetical protein L7F22_061629 [Adiantum nelumboides]|nr:hypothetical protein [Adiantum nelumboides]
MEHHRGCLLDCGEQEMPIEFGGYFFSADSRVREFGAIRMQDMENHEEGLLLGASAMCICPGGWWGMCCFLVWVLDPSFCSWWWVHVHGVDFCCWFPVRGARCWLLVLELMLGCCWFKGGSLEQIVFSTPIDIASLKGDAYEDLADIVAECWSG